MRFQTRTPIEYENVPYGRIAVIPAGTECMVASNLPAEDGLQFWAEPWDGMSFGADCWQRSYGFLLQLDDVEEVAQ